ncbi:hypothetical protein [Jatrophihabitans endophyticus]|nr:hypothetical protein [Jatrophihabitans endophyticus]
MESHLAAMHTREDDGRLVVDLTGVRTIRPVHMVAVLARARAAREDGLAFHLDGPALRDPGVYAARMRVGSSIERLGGTHTLPTDIVEHDRARSLLEVSSIATRDEVRALAKLVHGKVTPVDPALANALWEGICEIGMNVQEHAETVGYVAAQTMPNLGELRFAIGDAGRGILSTLRPRGATDHRTAIDLALSGVSRHLEADSGTGIRETTRLVTELSGAVLLASGDAEVVVGETTRTARVNAASFSGTLFEATIPLPSGRHAARLS